MNALIFAYIEQLKVFIYWFDLTTLAAFTSTTASIYNFLLKFVLFAGHHYESLDTVAELRISTSRTGATAY